MQTAHAYEGYPDQATATWHFPVVTSLNAHQRKTTWQIAVTGHGEKCVPPVNIAPDELLGNKELPAGYYATYKVASGVVDGKTRDTAPTVVTSGKNKGKKNETNVFCQAMNEAQGKYNLQLRKAVTSVKIQGIECYPPMLSQTAEEAKITFPISLQLKYDGLRAVACLGTDAQSVIMYTRTRVEIMGLHHIKSALLSLLQQHPAWYLDGEVYCHGMALQDISGLVREETPSDKAGVLQYIVYDCFCKDETQAYLDRKKRVDALLLPESGTANDEGNQSSVLFAAKTWTANNQGEVRALYKEALDAGFEGVILRKNGPYELSYNNRHSKYLLKMKPTEDAEFAVVGYKVGTVGKTTGCVIMVCSTERGFHFSVNPAMDIPARIELAKKMAQIELNGQTYFANNWLGKKITVQYASLSNDGVPQQPRTSMHVRID